MLSAIRILDFLSVVVFKHLLLLRLELRWIVCKLSHNLLLLTRSLLLVLLCLVPKVWGRDRVRPLRRGRIVALTLRAARRMASSRSLSNGVALRIVRLLILLRLLAASLRHPRIVMGRFDLGSGGSRIESLRRARGAVMPVVGRARPVVAIVNGRPVAQHLLVVLELLKFLLVFVYRALRHLFRRAGRIRCCFGALGEIMG